MPLISAELSPQGIISYAYLFKKVEYPIKFTRRAIKKLMFHGKNGKKNVESFIVEENGQLEQVLVYDYKNKDNFVIALKDVKDHDQIFLYKTSDNKEVKDVIHYIQ